MRRLLGKGRCVRRLLLLLLLRVWRMRWKWLGLSGRRLIRWWLLLVRHHRGRRMGLTHLKLLLLGIRRLLLLLLLTRLTITLSQLMR